MKTRRNAFAAVCAAMALAGSTWAGAASAQTVDEIIAKNIDARGGKAKIQAVKSAIFVGKMTAQGMEAPITLKWERPNKVRMEFTLQGMTGIQAYDGETGWMVMPFLGKKDPEKMTADDLKDIQDMADLFDGPLMDYAAKGHQVELIGKESVEGTEAYKLKLTRKTGDVSMVYIDAEAFLEIKSVGTRKTPQGELEIESAQGDFKEIDGLLFPMSMESKPKGAPAGQTITVEKVELNAAVQASDFAMPAVAPAPAEQKQ